MLIGNILRKAKAPKAPEIIGINEKGWINSKPLSLDNLQGKVVLLDFWTYSCVNCLRTLPALKEMWKKYKNKRFMLIGIHTPEFDFEKEIGNVKYAVKKHGIEYPVASDPERINWNRYGNNYWPRAALINSSGELIFDHVGESGYDEIEGKIIEELAKLKEIKQSEIEKIKEKKRAYELGISKETYAGSLRNEGLGSAMVCTKHNCNEYFDNQNYEKDVLYPHGDWLQEKEFLEFKGKKADKQNATGHLAFKYYASEVNVVMAGNGTAEVLLDNKPLAKDKAGSDIIFKDNKSYVKIDGADMYNLIKAGHFHEGVLKLIPFKGMKVYAYTFG